MATYVIGDVHNSLWCEILFIGDDSYREVE